MERARIERARLWREPGYGESQDRESQAMERARLWRELL